MASMVLHVCPKGRCWNEEVGGFKQQLIALCKNIFSPRGSERSYQWVLKDSPALCRGNKEFQLDQILLWQLDRSSQMGDFRAALQKKKEILCIRLFSSAVFCQIKQIGHSELMQNSSKFPNLISSEAG